MDSRNLAAGTWRSRVRTPRRGQWRRTSAQSRPYIETDMRAGRTREPLLGRGCSSRRSGPLRHLDLRDPVARARLPNRPLRRPDPIPLTPSCCRVRARGPDRPRPPSCRSTTVARSRSNPPRRHVMMSTRRLDGHGVFVDAEHTDPAVQEKVPVNSGVVGAASGRASRHWSIYRNRSSPGCSRGAPCGRRDPHSFSRASC